MMDEIELQLCLSIDPTPIPTPTVSHLRRKYSSYPSIIN
jgi:hypothetical protein